MTVKVTVELPEDWLPYLRVLGDPAEVIRELADHAYQGVMRPGSWERGWLSQAIAPGWQEKLECDPDAYWRERPRDVPAKS